MSRNKNILVITERFYPEEFGLNDLVMEWHRQGIDVEVLTQAPSYPFDKIFKGYKNRPYQTMEWNGIKIHRIYSLLGYKKNVSWKVANYLFFAIYASVIGLFVGRKFQNVYVYHIGPLTQALPALLLKKLFRKNLFVWTLDIWPDSVFAYGFRKNRFSSFLLGQFVSLIYRNCKAIFISCKGFREKIEKYAPEAKIVFTPQWAPADLDFENVRPNPDLPEGINFTFAGNIGKVQNLENVIMGFSKMDLNGAVGKDIHLNIIGDGSNFENLQQMVKDLSIPNVHFRGRRPLTEMPAWFEGSDALVISLADQPIFTLTVPAKFQAYLAAGKPIICIMKGEVARMVSEYAIGLTADPENLDEIRRVFESFVSMPKDERKKMIQNMHMLLMNDYDQSRVIHRKTESIFGPETKAVHDD